MAGQHAVTEVEDLGITAVRDDSVIWSDAVNGNVTSFRSSVNPDRHFVAVNLDTEQAATFYVDRATALKLAEQFVGIANDLAPKDRFDVKPQHYVLSDSDRVEFYSVGFTDGINSERRRLAAEFGGHLRDLAERLVTPR